MYFSAIILWYNSIIIHEKYISANSFPNNIKRFNKICIMCSFHIMNKTMNLSHNLMKNPQKYLKNIISIWNIRVYVIHRIKYQRYGVSMSEWIDKKRRVSNKITITIERTWKVWRLDIWTMGGEKKSKHMEYNSHEGKWYGFPNNEIHTIHNNNIYKRHTIGN